MPQCRLWIAPADLLLAHPGNSVNFTLAIPLVPALAGLVVGTQALVLDAAAPSGVGAMTNGGVMRLY